MSPYITVHRYRCKGAPLRPDRLLVVVSGARLLACTDVFNTKEDADAYRECYADPLAAYQHVMAECAPFPGVYAPEVVTVPRRQFLRLIKGPNRLHKV